MPHYDLSIVVPDDLLNCAPELQSKIKILQSDRKNIEIIFISKNTAATRAERLNVGFHKAQADTILFHHPRSWLADTAFDELFEIKNININNNLLFWGGFTHQFDLSHFLLKFTSWYSNYVRGPRGVLYLDHCLFFHRSLWKSEIAPVAIFEDTLLSQNLMKASGLKPIILNSTSTTSAVRFTKNGIWRQAVMNQILKVGFFLNIPHEKMNSIYEKGLGLNDPKNG